MAISGPIDACEPLRKKMGVPMRVDSKDHGDPRVLSIIAAAMSLCFLTGIVEAVTYEVGSDPAYPTIGSVPWESLAAGDSVRIHWQEDAYHEKWVICRLGTENNPIVVQGVQGPDGQRPVISGIDASTRSELNFWNEARGLVKIGGANSPPDCTPSYIILEGLELRSARPPYSFYGRSGYTPYVSNAAAVYVEKGVHLTLRDCILQDCGNGLFISWNTEEVLVDGCQLHDNGMEGSIYQHNSYCESQGIVYQFNHYGPLRSKCGGNNLKDRSSGCVIRFNWIESGNRQLDLVDSDFPELYNDPSYRETFVYGNILVEPDSSGNSQVCHYGGDSGTSSHYRKGTLHFYHNTVVSTRSGNTTLFRLSTNDESCDCRNNVVYVAATGSHLAMLDESGTLNLRNNWFKMGWRNCHGSLAGEVNDLGGMVNGTSPGFWDDTAQEYWPTGTSDCLDAGTGLAAACNPDHVVELEYVKHHDRKARALNGTLDIGAYEYPHGGGIPSKVQGLVITPEGNDLSVLWRQVVQDTCVLPLSVDTYRLYGANEAFLAPSSVLLLADVADTTFPVPGVTPDPQMNHFFRVTAVKAGVEGEPSTGAGAFDFDTAGN